MLVVMQLGLRGGGGGGGGGGWGREEESRGKGAYCTTKIKKIPWKVDSRGSSGFLSQSLQKIIMLKYLLTLQSVPWILLHS